MPKWAFKIAVKLVLGRVPYRHTILKKLGIFRHGKMEDIDYALRVFQKHINWAYPDGMPPNLILLELGPGDSLVSALIAKSYGAEKIYHVDIGAYAEQDVELYRKFAEQLRAKGLDSPDLSETQTMQDVMEICGSVYMVKGLESLKKIPSDSVDFIWSHSVVEHIRKREFRAIMLELSRIVKFDGRVSHNVDLQDHLEKKLNNLRFSDRFWENDIVADSGFYTNRLRYTQSLDLMKNSGFSVLNTETGKWESIPTPREKLHHMFRDFDDEELKIRTYRVLLEKAA
ncbi:MAG: class I SAM-dependent methyltransferase [Alphaproteobacteria bacterium]|nr:class I SAM-dependent methyltransferase [Alphaproteobacteria bacterium]